MKKNIYTLYFMLFFLIIIQIILNKSYINVIPVKTITRTIGNDTYIIGTGKYNNDVLIKLIELRKYMYSFCKKINNDIDKFSNIRPNILLLKKRIKGIILKENVMNNSSTSYTYDKGKEMTICLRKGKHFFDDNVLHYVILHEISHIACDEYGHTKKFNYIFEEFVLYAILIGYYNKVDYKNNPYNYCGLIINASIV